MARTMLKGHVSRALDFFNKPDIYFGIGKTTAWEDEYAPPAPLETDELEEPVGYKKAESKFLVKPDPEGELVYRNIKWKIISPSEALTEGARWVYLSSSIAYTEFPVSISYRQVAVFTGLTRADEVDAGKYNLLPSEVDDPVLLKF